MPRRSLAINISWDDIHSYISHVQTALSLAAEDGDKALAAPAAAAQKHLDQWTRLDGERRDRQRAVIRAGARVALRDVALEGTMTGLHHDLLAGVKQNRKAPLFKRLFPKPLSTVTKPGLEVQLGSGRMLLQQLIHPDTPAALRKAHEKPLKDALAAGEAALKERETARAAQQALSTQLTGLREAADRTLLGIEGQLKALAGERGLGVGFVNAFFPASAGKKRGEAAAKPGSGPGSTPPAPV